MWSQVSSCFWTRWLVDSLWNVQHLLDGSEPVGTWGETEIRFRRNFLIYYNQCSCFYRALTGRFWWWKNLEPQSHIHRPKITNKIRKRRPSAWGSCFKATSYFFYSLKQNGFVFTPEKIRLLSKSTKNCISWDKLYVKNSEDWVNEERYDVLSLKS